MSAEHRIGIYDDYEGPEVEPDPYAIGDGMYYDGGLYGPNGGPDTRPTVPAIRERVTDGEAETTVWHKAVAPCDGECDFHQIACSTTDGIVMPGPQQDVPLDLDRPGERWCPDCLALITDGLAELFVRLGPPSTNTTEK